MITGVPAHEVESTQLAQQAEQTKATKPTYLRASFQVPQELLTDIRDAVIAHSGPGDKWHLDEVALKIRGKRHWLWRAVDQHGVVLDILVQGRRDQASAERFLRRVLDGEGGTEPRVVITVSWRATRRRFGGCYRPPSTVGTSV
jgi:hypothetical protein